VAAHRRARAAVLLPRGSLGRAARVAALELRAARRGRALLVVGAAVTGAVGVRLARLAGGAARPGVGTAAVHVGLAAVLHAVVERRRRAHARDRVADLARALGAVRAALAHVGRWRAHAVLAGVALAVRRHRARLAEPTLGRRRAAAVHVGLV